ncbi:hypothetical protein SG34_018500 [Thalassomonas viridans]|uniref:DUF7450 domain-containing protein n=1 Tax=Thalassomonas viridans TaxID=137584 RepID=A0AAE9YZM6_9GAMM|nr:hypothetical protein [Thalassomonas viridans]WDE03380.1 hypothetical protein SG34_018500 [Thalassomonas viridans]
MKYLNHTEKKSVAIKTAGVLALAFCWPISAANTVVAAAEDPTGVLDHFMCYDIEEQPAPADIHVKVRDQFLEQGYRVLELTKLCAPAEKHHNGKIFEIKYEFAHLACYNVQPDEMPAANAHVNLYNQFGSYEKLFVYRVREICVPTIKEHL